ncbi:hypothetical protein J2T02_004091 [Chitinophaga terrae (ex Kim and Jung 2007)]|nr:hypothetical protein [Chitinophaga terrae (ex Kim and Jung 2007)]
MRPKHLLFSARLETAISGVLMGVPALPVIIVKIAGYLAVAGTVISGVSQAAVQKEEGG